jgi:toxin ParE1/3/4
MRALRLTRRARTDLENIWRYSLAQWGEAQALDYLAQIEEGLRLLMRHPGAGQRADDIRPGCRMLLKARHMIFYETGEEAISIIAILHERMDPARHV